MTEKEKTIVAKYLLDKAKRLIKNARLSRVDELGQLFHGLLIELGKEKEAEELFNYYQETMGG